MEFAGGDGTFQGSPPALGVETDCPASVRWDQPFFGFRERIAVKISWMTELSLSLDMPISSDAAATTTQKAGWERIDSRCMVMDLCNSMLAIAGFEEC